MFVRRYFIGIMNISVLHDHEVSAGNGYLRSLLTSCGPLADICLEGLMGYRCLFGDYSPSRLAIPSGWPELGTWANGNMVRYSVERSLLVGGDSPEAPDDWLSISDARFVTDVDSSWLSRVLSDSDADVVFIHVDPHLMSFRENVILTADGDVAGFRRLYSDVVWPCPFPSFWPHHVFIRSSILARLARSSVLPLDFSEFFALCRSSTLSLRSFRIAGSVLDLETASGVMFFFRRLLESGNYKQDCLTRWNGSSLTDGSVCNSSGPTIIQQDVRLFGTIVVGNNIRIGKGALIVGPVVLGNGVTIGENAVVRGSLIGSGVTTAEKGFVQDRVLLDSHPAESFSSADRPSLMSNYFNTKSISGRHGRWRNWPRFSYGGFFKRLADIFAASAALLLFAPVFPVIALAIKLSSRGPVFFRHKRQGLHSREFGCVKFRTMIVGADNLQDRLRAKNQVDGPQFKIESDPRVTAVGKFLRDTCIDEIPQFWNVLLGQMSLVGPRPSPEKENTFCARWRDARLSIRPGITGLWQIRRTRDAGQDFQEWVIYDTEYVRSLSLRLDLWICFETFKKLLKNFFSKF